MSSSWQVPGTGSEFLICLPVLLLLSVASKLFHFVLIVLLVILLKTLMQIRQTLSLFNLWCCILKPLIPVSRPQDSKNTRHREVSQ